MNGECSKGRQVQHGSTGKPYSKYEETFSYHCLIGHRYQLQGKSWYHGHSVIQKIGKRL